MAGRPRKADKAAQVTITISGADLERIKRAVYWTPGANLSLLFRTGALEVVARLEKERGGEFPPVPSDTVL